MSAHDILIRDTITRDTLATPHVHSFKQNFVLSPVHNFTVHEVSDTLAKHCTACAERFFLPSRWKVAYCPYSEGSFGNRVGRGSKTSRPGVRSIHRAENILEWPGVS